MRLTRQEFDFILALLADAWVGCEVAAYCIERDNKTEDEEPLTYVETSLPWECAQVEMRFLAERM